MLINTYNFYLAHVYPQISGVIYLDTPVDECIKRITRRNRGEECTIEKSYLEAIKNKMDEILKQFAILFCSFAFVSTNCARVWLSSEQIKSKYSKTFAALFFCKRPIKNFLNRSFLYKTSLKLRANLYAQRKALHIHNYKIKKNYINCSYISLLNLFVHHIRNSKIFDLVYLRLLLD